MNKKLLLALAKAIRLHNREADRRPTDGAIVRFNCEQIETLATFCESQNPRFKREQWLAFIKRED
jgi:hypothetical protein